MKIVPVVLVAFMAMTAPVFAQEEETLGIVYKIRKDTNEDYEHMLEKNKEIFEQLNNQNLFENWVIPEKEIPSNAKDIYKKPAFSASIEKHNKHTDYIRCEENTSIK